MRSLYANAFLKACAFLQIRVVIPEIVLDETKGKYREKLKQKADSFKKNHKELSKLTELPDFNISLDDLVEEYIVWLDELVENNNIAILEYPNISIKEIVETSYQKQKPFKASGEGHKDYVIWETIKQEIEGTTEDSTYYFLTNNTDDFCSKNAEGDFVLHQELAAQIEAQEKHPIIYLSVKKLFDEVLNETLGVEIDEIPNATPQFIYEQVDLTLRETLQDYTTYSFEDVPFSNDVTVVSVEDIHTTEMHINKIEDEVLINVTGHVELVVDGYIDKFDYYHMSEHSDIDIDVIDGNHNDHVMSVSTTIDTPFELTLFFSNEENQIIGKKLYLPEEIDPHWA